MEVEAGCQTWPELLSLMLQRGALATGQAEVYWNTKYRHVLSVCGAPGGGGGVGSPCGQPAVASQMHICQEEHLSCADFAQGLSWV
jgi:hypothetical protein